MSYTKKADCGQSQIHRVSRKAHIGRGGLLLSPSNQQFIPQKCSLWWEAGDNLVVHSSPLYSAVQLAAGLVQGKTSHLRWELRPWSCLLVGPLQEDEQGGATLGWRLLFPLMWGSHSGLHYSSWGKPLALEMPFQVMHLCLLL